MCCDHVVLENPQFSEPGVQCYDERTGSNCGSGTAIMENGRRQEWPGHSSSKKNPPYQTKASLHFGVNTKLIHECFLSKFDFVHPQPLFLELWPKISGIHLVLLDGIDVDTSLWHKVLTEEGIEVFWISQHHVIVQPTFVPRSVLKSKVFEIYFFKWVPTCCSKMSKIDRIGSLLDECVVCFEIYVSYVYNYTYTFHVSQKYFWVPQPSGLVLPPIGF